MLQYNLLHVQLFIQIGYLNNPGGRLVVTDRRSNVWHGRSYNRR